MKGAGLYPYDFFRSLGPAYPQEYNEEDLVGLPAGAVCRLVESFGRSLMGREGGREGEREGGGDFLEVTIAARRNGSTPLLGRGFVTEPLARVSVLPLKPEALEVKQKVPEEVKAAVNILMFGQETWMGEEEGGREGGKDGGGKEPVGYHDIMEVVEQAPSEGVSFSAVCREMALMEAGQEKEEGEEEEEGRRGRSSSSSSSPSSAIKTMVRECLSAAAERGAVLRVPSYFGPRFVAPAKASPWMIVVPSPPTAAAAAAAAAEEEDTAAAITAAAVAEPTALQRLALPWLTVPEGRLHRVMLLRALRSLVTAVHARPGLTWLEIRSECLPMFSFSEVLLLLRACVAAGVVRLERVRRKGGRKVSLWSEGRRQVLPCPGAEWKFYDDLQVEVERGREGGREGGRGMCGWGFRRWCV